MTDIKQIVNLVHFTSQPGGIEVILPFIVDSMPYYHFRGFVINKSLGSERNVYDFLNIPVVYGNGVNLQTLLNLMTYARRNRKEIFHALNTGPLILLLLQLVGVQRIVYSIHGTIHWKKVSQRFIIKYLWAFVLRKYFPIISNSEYSKNVFLNKINPSAIISTIYNPIDREKFSPYPLNKDYSGLKIIYVGRLTKGKNLEKWLEIAALIHDSFPETQFEIYGYGPLMNSLEDQISRHNASTFIFLKGFREDIASVYRNADILLFISEYESFGNVVVESILCGTPVIVSNIPSMKEIFRDFPEFIIDLDKNLMDNIFRKLNDLNKLRDLTLMARDQFLKRFSIETYINALDKVYNSLNG